MTSAVRIIIILIIVYVAAQNIVLNEEVKRLDRQFEEAAWRAEASEQQLHTLKKVCGIE